VIERGSQFSLISIKTQKTHHRMSCSNPQKVVEALTKAFNEVDADHSGSITCSEIERVLLAYHKHTGKPVDQQKIQNECKAFLRDVDKDQNGKIELNEFINYFKQFC